MFGRGAKIVVTLKPANASHAHGPVAASGFNSLRFVFRNGGEEDFYKRYVDALNRQAWKRTSSSSSSAGSKCSNAHTGSLSGASGQRGSYAMSSTSEKRLSDHATKVPEAISQAFEELCNLMLDAKDTINLSKRVTERVTGDKNVTEEEMNTLTTYLYKLGVPLAKALPTCDHGVDYYEHLARRIAREQFDTLKARESGAMSLVEMYCRINQGSDSGLVSPEDVLNACRTMEALKLPMRLSIDEYGVTSVVLSTNSKPQAS